MISSPGCAGRQCSANAPSAARSSSASIEPVGRERLAAGGRLVVGVAHRHPDVGVDDVGALDRLAGIGRRRALVEHVAVGRGDDDLDAGQRAEDHQRAGDVVAVAHVGELAARDVAERLAHRHQVGERLARMVARRQQVEDRHGRVLGQLGEPLVAARAQPDRGHVAGEHERGVAHGLAARELQLVGAQHHRVAAQLGDSRLHRDTRARRRLLEQDRHRAAGQRVGAGGRLLERQGAIEDRRERRVVELLTGDEVPRQGRQTTAAARTRGA